MNKKKDGEFYEGMKNEKNIKIKMQYSPGVDCLCIGQSYWVAFFFFCCLNIERPIHHLQEKPMLLFLLHGIQ